MCAGARLRIRRFSCDHQIGRLSGARSGRDESKRGPPDPWRPASVNAIGKRASLAELAGSPRQAAAAAAAGTGDTYSAPASADHCASSAAAGAPGHRASSAASGYGAAPAAAATPLGVLLAEPGCSGAFPIEDEEFRQADVGEFLLAEGDHGKRALRRSLLRRRNSRRCAASHREGHPGGPPNRQGVPRALFLRSLLRARHLRASLYLRAKCSIEVIRLALFHPPWLAR